MIINVWLAIRDDAHAHITELPEITNLMGDRENVQSAFRQDTTGGTWTLWSLNLESDGPTAQDEITSIRSNYPGAIRILGAWDFDTGEQITGFLIHTRILEFIPDTVTYDEEGLEVSRSRPTVARDVNLLMGQAPRTF